MRKASQHHMLHLLKLFPNGGVDTTVGMAEQIDPPGPDGIEVAFAVMAV